MLDRRRFVALSSASALAPAFARVAQAQAYPTRFVRLVVPFPPGGGTDAIARVVSAKLSAIWGQQMVVENKGGGATSIGTDAVAKAEPDGHTVLLQSMPLAVNKYLFATLPFDPVADLAPVSLICDYPNVMAVPMSSPAHSVAEFIAYAKANPGKANYASSGLESEGGTPNFWTGLRPATPTNIPYIGQTKVRGLWVNAGHGTLGWTHGAGSGKAMAELISGVTPPIKFGFYGVSVT